MDLAPKKIPGNEHAWRCPQCGMRLPDATLMVATWVLNNKHLPRCNRTLKKE